MASFKKIVERRASALNLPGFALPPFDEELAKESINASKAYIDALATKRKTSFENYRAVFLWVVAIVGAFLSILLGMADKDAPFDPRFVTLANWLKANPLFLAVPFSAVFAWWTAMTIWVGFPETRRDFIRLSLFNKTAGITISLLLFAVLQILVVYFFPINK